MILTTRGRYAIMAISDMTTNGGEAQPSCLKDIARRQKISAAYLEQIFLKLKKAGIVKAVKGPGGGYLLARAAQQISAADVIAAIEPIKMTRCGSAKKGCRSNYKKCQTHNLWYGLEQAINNYLSSVNIAKVAQGMHNGIQINPGCGVMQKNKIDE